MPAATSTSTSTSSSTMLLSEADRRPKVGVGVFVLDKEDRFLMGKRKGSNGAGTWALPGGHLEFQESFEDCAVRELEEETGLRIRAQDTRFMTCTNNILEEDGGKHYVTIFMVGRAPEGQMPQNLESNKCEGWEWISWPQLLDWIQAGSYGSQQSTQQQVDGSASHSHKLFPPMATLVATRPGLLPQGALSVT